MVSAHCVFSSWILQSCTQGQARAGEHPQNPSFEDNNPANEDPRPQERQKERGFTRNFLLLKVRVLAKSNFYLQIKKLVIFPDFSLLNRTRTKRPLRGYLGVPLSPLSSSGIIFDPFPFLHSSQYFTIF